MSNQKRISRRAGALVAPAGILAIALAGACDRSAEQAGMEGEPPPPMEQAAGEPEPAQAGGGEDPYAQAEAPRGASAPSGEAPPAAGGGHAAMAGEAPAGEPITDEQLESFAEAYLEVEDVQQELEAELRAAQSNEEAQAIQQRAIGEIRDAVEETGMDFETYGLIAQRLQQDPALIQRVEQTIDQMRN